MTSKAELSQSRGVFHAFSAKQVRPRETSKAELSRSRGVHDTRYAKQVRPRETSKAKLSRSRGVRPACLTKKVRLQVNLQRTFFSETARSHLFRGENGI